MRASEFCLIVRDCLIEDESKYYIQLPRIKQNSRRIQVMDKVLIDQEMHQLISHYISLTNQFGKTETLISYFSIMNAEQYNRGHIQKYKSI